MQDLDLARRAQRCDETLDSPVRFHAGLNDKALADVENRRQLVLFQISRPRCL